MRRFLGLCMVLVFMLTGCASLRETIEPFVPRVYQGDLWKIRIGGESKELFSGLLVLAREEKTLSFQLLDATGITLLSAVVKKQGDLYIHQAVPKVEKGRLPAFLATSLQRIFLIEGKDCYWAVPDKNMSCEHVKWGALSAWEVDYRFDENTQEILQVELDQWWPRPDIFLWKL